MEELSNRQKINAGFEWYEKHRLKIVSQDTEVQKMLDSMGPITVYTFPKLSPKWSKPEFEDD